ncbi:MAG: UvrB/UvrC motif-containing protein [Candidatus Omnitrophota bacterium]|nr:UvrB/UvrC motif-containing protein [Candidatus Omnitrophota bacterium]
MKCNICGMNEASVHLTEVINEQVTKLHLCEQCAKDKSEEMQAHFGLTDLLSGLMDLGSPMAEGALEEGLAVKCPVCSMTFYDFQKTGRFGCGGCYETFQKNLSELLRKIHGSDRHVGKRPFSSKSEKEGHQVDIKRLREELNELVLKEEFEKAAVVRDRIKDLEK